MDWLRLTKGFLAVIHDWAVRITDWVPTEEGCVYVMAHYRREIRDC